jgi:hypothetical protein
MKLQCLSVTILSGMIILNCFGCSQNHPDCIDDLRQAKLLDILCDQDISEIRCGMSLAHINEIDYEQAKMLYRDPEKRFIEFTITDNIEITKAKLALQKSVIPVFSCPVSINGVSVGYIEFISSKASYRLWLKSYGIAVRPGSSQSDAVTVKELMDLFSIWLKDQKGYTVKSSIISEINTPKSAHVLNDDNSITFQSMQDFIMLRQVRDISDEHLKCVNDFMSKCNHLGQNQINKRNMPFD